MRVAIIGGGPRGLWAAEELRAQAESHAVTVDIDVWEPGELGPGSAYSTTQPDHWRLNVRSQIIRTGLGSFDQWRIDRGEPTPLEPFPARSLVGQFMKESWARLSDAITHVPRRAESITPATDDHRWSVDGEVYDEVLIATGHAPTWPGALDTVGVFPPDRLREIPPGSTVAVRGAALTFIDAALELASRGITRIIPTSQTGRFMEVKPQPGSRLDTLDVRDIVRSGSTALRMAEDDDAFHTALMDASAKLLVTALHRSLTSTEHQMIADVIAGTDASGDPVAELRESLDVARGDAEPGARWAVGAAWRELYPAVVWRASFHRRESLPGFTELARTLERVAFGPPPVNAARILELIDAGVIDVSASPDKADVTVDAVLAPPGVVPGSLVGDLVDRGLARIRPGARGVDVAPDGTVVGAEHLAVVGRDAEDVVVGPDTLNRALHDVIPRWARRVIGRIGPRRMPTTTAEATVPLTGRLEPWAVDLLSDAKQCDSLIANHGSPVNVLRTAPLLRNVSELVDTARDSGIEARIFFARKANKALAFVDAIRDAGHGIDVASENELRQVLDAGIEGPRIILSAAVKPDQLLELAVRNNVTVSVDSVPELHRLHGCARTLGAQVNIAPRLAPDPAHLPPTRFGERLDVWREALPQAGDGISVAGVHVHLHGYAIADRQRALDEALMLIDAASSAGHHPEFIDLGGGVPMSYLDDASQWEAFQDARRKMIAGEVDSFTWKDDPLNNTYPFYQEPVRGAWLSQLEVSGLIERGLRLHLEPGRSVLDGCGVILARVAFLKTRSDGLPLIGVEMNRTQCRTTSDDILVDPVLIQCSEDPDGGWGADAEGYLVGAYCIEDEVIIRRRMRFPEGIAPGDIIAIPNTAGYFMHILESASHQIPLAKNVVLESTAHLDRIDAG